MFESQPTTIGNKDSIVRETQSHSPQQRLVVGKNYGSNASAHTAQSSLLDGNQTFYMMDRVKKSNIVINKNGSIEGVNHTGHHSVGSTRTKELFPNVQRIANNKSVQQRAMYG